MSWVGGIVLVVGFLAFLRLFGLVERSQRGIAIMQSHTRQSFALFGWPSPGGVLAVLLPGAGVAAGWAGFAVPRGGDRYHSVAAVHRPRHGAVLRLFLVDPARLTRPGFSAGSIDYAASKR